MCKPPVVVDNLTLKHDGGVNIKLLVKGGKLSVNGEIYS